ncbi:hypothetical protein C4564_05035 [Candidatus Microgenomates bacterium]|nr:MAG: hypothetical protein C4564_05035 [Candidatus Microgenomates bacterium]
MRRKYNYVSALIITGLLWLVAILLVFATEPEKIVNQIVLLIIVYFALFFTFGIVLGSKRRGAIVSGMLLSFLIIAYFGAGSVVNFLLLVGVSIALERLTSA